MDAPFLTRSYLETLSSADLIALADDYDIDVPEDLNRRFIIGELLDVADELKHTKKNDMIISSATPEESDNKLPDTYNETQVTVILRNPVWAYVYWDIREADMHLSSLSLNVLFFEKSDDVKPSDSFDIQIENTDREQYILLPAGKKFVRIDLIGAVRGTADILASYRKVELPHGCEALISARPGKTVALSPIMKLSGMEELLKQHYAQHRQSFS